MALRCTLMVAALSLALAGCNYHAKHRTAKRLAYPAPSRIAQPAARQPLYLRGRFDGQDWQPTVRRPAAAKRARPLVAAAQPFDSAPYRLDSGDRLRITVFGQDNLSRIYGVDGGGFISMPLIGAVATRGATTFELEERIAGKLRTKYVKDPKVTVEVQAYRPFFILGEVRRPGQFPYVNGMTVQTAVAIAGGYTERARERKVKLTRRVNGRSITVKVPSSSAVRPGDTIYVLERFF